MRDYKKTAFSKLSPLSAKPKSFTASFVPASLATRSIESGTNSYSSHMKGDAEDNLAPQIAESSRRGSRQSVGQQASRQTLDQKWLGSTHHKPSSLPALNEAYFSRTPRSHSADPLHPMALDSTPPSSSHASGSSINHAKQSVHSSAPSGRNSNHPRPAIGLSPRRPSGYSPTISVHVSKKSASKAQVSEPPLMGSTYGSTRPPGECSPKPTSACSSRKTRALQDRNFSSMDYDMASVEGGLSTTLSSRPVSHSLSPCVVPDLPSATSSLPRTEAADISQARVQPVAPTAGIKRRLGMGRSTTGYSNKKFKHPV
ncbi:hypothetical protein BDZ97DRAFT_1094866 [Flammula alnicola]|nr:hypothetical protein BDZ97DRAFT_1094866 [Flammula alnicola]